MDIFVKKDSLPFNRKWAAIQSEFRVLKYKYPQLNAFRRRLAKVSAANPKTNDDRELATKTEWEFDGPYNAIKAFKDLACQASELLGCHATKEIQVQFFLDHLFGDHIIFKENPRVKDDDVEYVTTDGLGNRQGYRGRQKI